mmetsp:Transcript_68060/g.142134  ORF Transcript_68060/g.142134 Transcript_68060/m.142134 type:complete len:84 (-) Transcript_68060:603-854(-)
MTTLVCEPVFDADHAQSERAWLGSKAVLVCAICLSSLQVLCAGTLSALSVFAAHFPRMTEQVGIAEEQRGGEAASQRFAASLV